MFYFSNDLLKLIRIILSYKYVSGSNSNNNNNDDDNDV